MSGLPSVDYPWVIFMLHKSQMAISAEHVQYMVVVSEPAKIPNVADHIRGVTNLRGTIVPLVDLRIRLGMPSFLTEVKEFCALMDQREKDHRRWLQELEASVREQREFTLATDPHKCAFGKWYDSYQPMSYTLASLLKQFEAPHRVIHDIAKKVFALGKKGDMAGAYKLIEECREKELAQMLTLFAKTKEYYRSQNREIAIVLKHQRKLVAMAVDSIDSVEYLEVDSMAEMPSSFAGEEEARFVTLIGHRKHDGSTVLILDTEQVVGHLGRVS
ncbi:MAG: chemotaxis protein CheW [Desulfurivibrionaceae bacterium]